MRFINRGLKFFVFSLFIAVMIPPCSQARLMITTQIAVGEIVAVQDNQIELDDGSIYIPAKKNKTLEIQIGDFVTVEFYTNPEDIKFYLNIALGENSLTPSPEPERKPRQPVY